jgi:hypothetical protein
VECTYDPALVGGAGRHVDSPPLDRLGLLALLVLWPIVLSAVRAEGEAAIRAR